MLSISSSDFNGQTVDMSAEGTEDWLSSPIVNPTTTFRHIGTAPCKRLGGRLLLYFDWTNPGGTGFTQAMGITRTSLASDTFDFAATSSPAINTSTGAGFNHASILDLGWRLRCPATDFPRRLRVYESHWSSILTVKARITDGQTSTVTHNTTAATVGRRRWTIDFDSNQYGAELLISFNLTTGHGSTPNIVFGAATLGVVP